MDYSLNELNNRLPKLIVIMKNTLENKAKFFAQYWGQEINFDWNGIVSRDAVQCSIIQLKTLSSIKVEEAEIIQINEGYISTIKAMEIIPKHSKEGVLSSISVDYLRSKGYPLPYMGLRVGTMVEYGWIELID